MKHESQNPLYARFKHLLSHADRYPAEHVDIFWNLTGDDAPRVKDVEVVFVPREALSDDELKAEYVRYNRQGGPISEIPRSIGWRKAATRRRAFSNTFCTTVLPRRPTPAGLWKNLLISKSANGRG
jgi:hypothetical protein